MRRGLGYGGLRRWIHLGREVLRGAREFTVKQASRNGIERDCRDIHRGDGRIIHIGGHGKGPYLSVSFLSSVMTEQYKCVPTTILSIVR